MQFLAVMFHFTCMSGYLIDCSDDVRVLLFLQKTIEICSKYHK